MHSTEPLSRVIPWTSSGIACRSSLPLHVVIGVIPSSREFADYQGSSETETDKLYLLPKYCISIAVHS